MAKVVIEIEDLPNGNVKITASPNFETMIKMDVSGHRLTAAHGYGIAMLNHARQESKKAGPIRAGMPRLLKA